MLHCTRDILYLFLYFPVIPRSIVFLIEFAKVEEGGDAYKTCRSNDRKETIVAKLKVNEKALKKAHSLNKSHHYVLDSDWSEAQPSESDENAYREAHGWEAYGEWFLAVDPDASAETKQHYKFPYGDFQRLHRSGVIAAKQRAAQNDYLAIEEAADELLTEIDKR